MGSKSDPFQRENGPFWHFFRPERSRRVLEGFGGRSGWVYFGHFGAASSGPGKGVSSSGFAFSTFWGSIQRFWNPPEPFLEGTFLRAGSHFGHFGPASSGPGNPLEPLLEGAFPQTGSYFQALETTGVVFSPPGMEPANPANAANPAQLEKPSFVMGSKSGPFQRENWPFWHLFLHERSGGVLERFGGGSG